VNGIKIDLEPSSESLTISDQKGKRNIDYPKIIFKPSNLVFLGQIIYQSQEFISCERIIPVKKLDL